MRRLFSSNYDFCLLRRSFSPTIPIQRQKSLICPDQSLRAFSATTSNSTTQAGDSTLQHIYEPLEGIERLENYRPGGYHPIQIDDQFQGRYQIVHKLGHGSYSTTWLARDTQSKKYVAVKVCTADSKPREFNILSDLSASSRDCSGQPLGKPMIPSILDQFSISGPNGTHDCYVGVLGRVSLANLREGSWIRLFQPDVARVLAAQLVLAVEYIHARGYVHGDLHPGNILLEMPPGFDQLSVRTLYEVYGEPELDPVVHLDNKPLPPGVPTHGVVPVWLGKASEDITPAEAKLLLTDFGEAFSPSQELKYESRTPLILRPPETRFEPESPLSFPSDIWTLACSIWALIAQRPLFEGFMATQDDMTCEHVDALGILPREWWERWGSRHDRFSEDGTPINRNPYRSWDDRFEDSVQQPRRESGMVPFGQEEGDAFSKMLRSMLSFRPGDRITARQVVGEEWMVNWALPQYYNSRHEERQ